MEDLMAAAELCDGAADVLLVSGWTKRSFSNMNGHCVLGAIAEAARPIPIVDMACYWPAVQALNELIGGGVSIPSSSIVAWNDRPERTEDEVHDVLRTAAKILRERAVA